MSQDARIPPAVIQRATIALRQLERFQHQDIATISSADLGFAIGASAAQVRKDLAHFGQLGKRGVGYHVASLAATLRSILALDREWPVALVGAGNLGRALCTHRPFRHRGFRIVALFDADPRKIGCTWARLTVQPMRDLPRAVRQHHIALGIIAVPDAAAQAVADLLVAAGLRGILNFAPTRVQVPEGVVVCSVDLAVELQQLAYLAASLEPTPGGDDAAKPQS